MIVSEIRKGLTTSGPVLSANSQGEGLASLFGLPDSWASFMSRWQAFAIGVVVAMVAAEALREGQKFEIFPRPKGRHEESLTLEEETAGQMPALPRKPRLVASRSDPVGNVTVIMAELIEAGKARDRVEFFDAFKAYARACRASGKRPLSVKDFGTQLNSLCRDMNIAVEQKGEHVYLLRVRLKEIEASAGQP
jgi:hypothetical protein